jgi:hypothetical protein
MMGRPRERGAWRSERAAAKVTPAVEVVAIPGRPPFQVGKFYVVTISGIDYPWPELVAGPFDTASEAAERRTGARQLARAGGEAR